MKTKMKLSELRPCDLCGGHLVPVFYQVEFSQMVLDGVSINRTLGLNQMFGGNALAMAEALTDAPDAAKEFSRTEGILCQDCFLRGLTPALMEKEDPE